MAACGLVACLLLASACALKPIDLDGERPLPLRTTIRAADGSVLARIYDPTANRVLVPPRRIPSSLEDAVLAAEDARFYDHPGYDIRAMARAAFANVVEGEVVQGGSTITQQYVKNAFFRGPGRRTFERKARELRLAIEIERRYSKKEILNRYLNTVYLGQGAYGIKIGAETYFRKDVDELRLHESALLAALIKSPALYDPRRSSGRAKARRDYVLDRMEKLGMISPARGLSASRAPLGIVRTPPRLSIREPYFVEAVTRELLSDRRLGTSDRERSRALFKGGMRVETTLRPRLQRAAESAVAGVLGQPGDPEAALVAIKPKTGEIVAMVGGRDWEASQVNLALGKEGGGSGRQSGSAFKPIVAAAALEAGISLDATYDASPAAFPLPGGELWVVNNSEGTSSGELTVSDAMVRSVNAVFARLSLELGAERVAAQAGLMGVRSKLPIYPSIALGASEVSVLDMATAYATIANGGTAVEPTTIREIRLRGGQALSPEQETAEGVVSPGNAYLLTRTLEGVIEEGTGTGADIGRPAAGKTGTTDDYADAWFVGYTPQLVAAVWVGYPEGRISMTNVHGITVFGGTFPAAIWRNFMTAAMRGRPVREFAAPLDEIVTVKIDPATGLLAAPWCPGVKRRMLRQFVPTETCPLPETESPVIVTKDPKKDDRKPSPSPTETRSSGDGIEDDEANGESPDPSPEPEPTRS